MASPNMWRCVSCGAPNLQSREACYYCKATRPPAQPPTEPAPAPSAMPAQTESNQALIAAQTTANVVTGLGNMVVGCIGIAVNLLGILLVWMFCG